MINHNFNLFMLSLWTHLSLHIGQVHLSQLIFVLHKLVLQTHMRSHPVGLNVWFLVGPSVYFHTSCVWTAKALVRLRECAGSPEPSLVAYVISTIISWAGSLCHLRGVWCTFFIFILNRNFCMQTVKIVASDLGFHCVPSFHLGH